MTDPLRDLLARADRPAPTFAADELAGWPPAARSALELLGLLAETPAAKSVPCDACGDDHVEPVLWADAPGGRGRAYIRCPENGRVSVPGDRLRRWAVPLDGLARAVAESAATTGAVEDLVPRRVWRLGVLTAGGRRWAGFLAVRVAEPDGAAVVDRVPDLRHGNALVFVPAAVPAAAVWVADRPPVVVRLADVLSLAGDVIALDRAFLDAAATPAGPPPRPGITPVRAPPGADWADVAVTVEDHHLRVRVGDTCRRVGFADAGFEDRRRKGVPDRVWVLLAALARGGGVLDQVGRVRTKSDTLKTRVCKLRDRLQALVGIDADPFHPVRPGGAYRARFAVRPAAGPVVAVPPGTTFEGVAVTEPEPGVVVVRVDMVGRTSVYVPGEDGGSGRREAASVDDVREHRFALRDLGLPPGAAAALVAVLRGGGRVRRGPGDRALLALGAALSDLIPAGGTPFAYDEAGRAWVARFAAGSVVPPT